MEYYSHIQMLEHIASKIQHNPAKSPLEKFLSKEQFIELYHGQNMALTEIADSLGVVVNRLHRIKRKYRIPTNHAATKKALQKHYKTYRLVTFRDRLTPEELHKKYVVEKKSMGDIAKEFGVSRAAVCKYLHKYEIPTRGKREARMLAMSQRKVSQSPCTIDKDFFSKWSRPMAWVLGLFLTDACLYGDDFGNPRISINSIDKDVIEKIQICLHSTYATQVLKKAGPLPQYRLEFACKPIYDDIVRLGLSPRKSLTVKMPQVPEGFFPDFARGVFEGDGSYVIDKRRNSLRLSLVSGSRDFIHEFAEGLGRMGLSQRHPYEYQRGKSKYYELKYGKQSDCRLYYELAYKNTPASMSMNRKRSIIENWYIRIERNVISRKTRRYKCGINFLLTL